MSPLPSRARAFSLIELLVSVVIVALLILIVSQITTGASKTTGTSRQRVSADSEARMVFDRMADDFAHMVNRKDVDFVFDKTALNDTAFFYSEAPAMGPDKGTAQTVALIGYRINAQNQLERLGKGLAWDQAPPDGMVFLTYQPAASPTPVGQAPTPKTESTIPGAFSTQMTDNANFHILGANVFRLEFSFLLKPYTDASGTLVQASYSKNPFNPTHVPPSGTKMYYGIGLGDVQAIIVTLAILDGRSRELVRDDALTSVAGKFTDAVDITNPVDGASLAKTWDTTILALSGSDLPQAAAAQVRAYQRTFYLASP
jgi:prepilin-type N-terminal cleavage/methylation domain-containing protein